MKIPVFILSAFLVAALASQGWLINEVVNLKVAISGIQAALHAGHLAAK
jgi:hypothetical protein